MQHAARHELMFLERAPILIAGPDQSNETELNAIARGVRYRSIADHAFLELPGVIARIRADIQMGEEVRVISELPFKMVMADRSVALIPLNLERPGSPALLLRASALLDALHAMFELLWSQAAPIAFTRAGKIQASKLPATVPQEAAPLLQLLSAGLNDKAITHELGISASTLNRRIGEIAEGRNPGEVVVLRLGEPQSAVPAEDDRPGHRPGRMKSELSDRTSRRDAADLVPVRFGEPQVSVDAGGDPRRKRICGRDGELGDDASRGYPANLVRKALNKPEVAVRAEGE